MIFWVWNCMIISTTCQDHVATCIQTQRPPLPAAGTQRTSCGWNVGAGRTTRTETTCSFQPTGRRLTSAALLNTQIDSNQCLFRSVLRTWNISLYQWVSRFLTAHQHN